MHLLQDPPQPEGWTEHEDGEGRPYFYCKATRSARESLLPDDEISIMMPADDEISMLAPAGSRCSRCTPILPDPLFVSALSLSLLSVCLCLPALSLSLLSIYVFALSTVSPVAASP